MSANPSRLVEFLELQGKGQARELADVTNDVQVPIRRAATRHAGLQRPPVISAGVRRLVDLLPSH
jgi:hypothetical protein